jgi:NAD(P)H-dependent flavin oxidoreductase YrpB (nitropropane dioxygenase family)
MSNKPAFIKELSLPAVAAPMFLISGPQLVIECCKNGIVAWPNNSLSANDSGSAAQFT